VPRKFAFIFVCQKGELESKACLLAASLKRYLRCEYELIAAVPRGTGEIAGTTRSFLSALDVRFVETGNEIDSAYAIGNKVDCLRVETGADKLVFLDTDMLLMRPLGDERRFDIPFNARPASYPTFTRDDADWEKVYRACGVPMPTVRIRTTYSGEYILPYFNAGFVAAPARSGFGEAWLECCRRIDRLDLPNKRPYLDQIALGVAAATLGMEMDCLEERYNHPINFKPMDERDLPYFCHYHDFACLMREPAAVGLARDLIEEHADLTHVLQVSEGASVLIENSIYPAREGITPELIITGIPRSGTSYLCKLLHRHDNCVVINEPAEAAAALMQEQEPFGVARLFRDLRRDVLSGKPIQNKLWDGEVSGDTAVAGAVEFYTPEVATADFVLGIKATVAFLSRLPVLRRAIPNARIVACVRDPLDCIASWKLTFAHLRDANVDGVNVGNSDDPWITGMQRKELKSIAAIGDAASRRAAWWSYLAGLILDSREHLILVRYEDLVLRPAVTLERIIGDWPAGEPREPMSPSSVRRKRELLDANDCAAIRALCGPAALALGLWK
jgi:hypothetical protein